MCKYCEYKVKYEGYEKEGTSIAEGQYSACCIIQPLNSMNILLQLQEMAMSFGNMMNQSVIVHFVEENLIKKI